MKPLLLVPVAASVLVASSATGRPYSFVSNTKYAEVDFSWSKEAGAVPALVRQFRTTLTRAQAETLRCGKEESAIRIKMGGEAIACSSSTSIKTSGQSARLLSLAREHWAFTGGAHGNGATTGILWDGGLNKEISFDSLFLSPAGLTQLRAPYCRALDAERKKRRGPDYEKGTITEFDTCPKFSDLALIAADSGHDGRFDQIQLIAAPYLAGSYAEGEYDIALPVTRQLIAAMKPEYRASFEAQRQ